MTHCIAPALYMPNISFFYLLSQYESFSFDQTDKFQKQTFRNRCEILLSNKLEKLIVPIKKSTGDASFISMEIDYTEDWQKKHWRSIQSGYGKTPFFEFYAPYLESEFNKQYKTLFELNVSLVKLFVKCLNLGVKEIDQRDGERLSRLVTAKKFPYEFKGPSYEQPFGDKFYDNLSILDLLFNVGPESLSVLKQYKIVKS